MPNRTAAQSWTPSLDTSILDKHMDTAMRRASGSVGLDIGMGQSVPETGFFKAGDSLDPREVGAEILREFQAEAVPAFQAARAALAAEALAYMKGRGIDETRSRAVLAAADGAFMVPEEDLFTKEGLPFAKAIAMPSTQALVGGIAGFACVFAFVRSPHLGIFSGVLIGGTAYYLARRRIRRRCEDIFHLLPRNLYQMLAAEWNANIGRYADRVNAARETE